LSLPSFCRDTGPAPAAPPDNSGAECRLGTGYFMAEILDHQLV
jgi:hypothetical protein